MTSGKARKAERSSRDDAPQSKRQRQSIEKLSDSEMEEVSLLNSSNGGKATTDQSKLDTIQSIQAKMLVLQNSIEQEKARLVKLGVHVSPITNVPTPPTQQDSEESNPLNPIQIAQEVEETDHPSSACSGSCSHDHFSGTFLPQEMLDAIKLHELIDKVLGIYKDSASNEHLGESMDDLTKETIDGLYKPIHKSWQCSENKDMLKDKGIIDGLNRTMQECGGFIPTPFNCNIDGKRKVVPFTANYTGPGAMKTWEMLTQVNDYFGPDVGMLVLNFCAYDIGDPNFLDYLKQIAILIRKLQPYLDQPEFKESVEMIKVLNSTLDTISHCCRKTQEYVYPAVCKYLADNYVVLALINFSTHTGRKVFGGGMGPFEFIGNYFSNSVLHDNQFHLSHLLHKEVFLTEENFQPFFLTIIVLHATSSDLNVVQVLEELKDEETADEHIGNIYEILKRFAYSKTRAAELCQYYLTKVRSIKLAILSKCIEQMNRERSNQPTSGQYIKDEISSRFSIRFKYVYPYEQCTGNIDGNGSRIPCPNICESKGLCKSCKYGQCRGTKDNGNQCGKYAQYSDGLCKGCKFGTCGGTKDNNFHCGNSAQFSDGLCQSCKFGTCRGHEDNGLQCKNDARSMHGFCNRHKFGKCNREENGVQCGNFAISDEGLCLRHKFGKCIHEEKGVQCINDAINSDHLCEDHQIYYCDRGCGNLGTVCVEMITSNVEKGSLGVTVEFADMIVITKVKPVSQIAEITKAGDILLSIIINGLEYSKWTSKKDFIDFIKENMNEKKTIVLARRKREQETISSNCKSSPQETSTCQSTDMTSSINIDSKETISINLCEKCYGFGMTDRSTFPCPARGLGSGHKDAILSVPEGQKLTHGVKLICEHDGCKARRPFVYCAFENHVFASRCFGDVIKHKCLEGKILCPYKKGSWSGPISHSGATLSPKRGEVLNHEGELNCSHEKCRNSGKSSLYCALCEEGVPSENFYDKSMHKCME
ncbi:predicted protein [Chaetoceros tenuissimus]|uniref:Uncharacterized protein n=1 Tax=Chaetoceros tenuissimus TaxID=426638 RepID=A0AAD3CHK3_9STRA|nr:predicted protein [Chaetoceros tenuissimus]